MSQSKLWPRPTAVPQRSSRGQYSRSMKFREFLEVVVAQILQKQTGSHPSLHPSFLFQFYFLELNSPQIWNQRWSASARLCHSRTDSSATGTSQGHIIQIWTHLFIIIVLLSLFLIRFFSVFQEIPILPHVWTWCSPQTILRMWNI